MEPGARHVPSRVRGRCPVSIRLMDLSLRAQGIEPVAKLILTQIANHADDDGDAWCYQRELAEVTGRDERTVRRATRQLEELGVLSTTLRSGGVKRAIPGHLKPNAYRVIEARLVELQPARRDRTPMAGQSERRPDTDDPSLRETGHPRPQRPDTHDRSRPDTHDPTESSTEPSKESSLSSVDNSHRSPSDRTADDDGIESDLEADIVALVAAKVMARANADGCEPKRGYGIRCAANLQPTGPDHHQVAELRALRRDRTGLERDDAAAIVVGLTPPIPPVSPGSVVSLEEDRQACSMVAGLVMAGDIEEARRWIDLDCPPPARPAALAELERRTGTRSAS